MNESDFNAFRQSVEDIFLALYTIDPGSLTRDERMIHQQQLSVAHLAVIRMENKAFGDLLAEAKGQLGPLAASTKAMQSQLAGLNQASQALTIVAQALNVLTRIAELCA